MIVMCTISLSNACSKYTVLKIACLNHIIKVIYTNDSWLYYLYNVVFNIMLWVFYMYDFNKLWILKFCKQICVCVCMCACVHVCTCVFEYSVFNTMWYTVLSCYACWYMFNCQWRLPKKWMASNFRVIEIVTMIREIKKCKVDIKIFTKWDLHESRSVSFKKRLSEDEILILRMSILRMSWCIYWYLLLSQSIWKILKNQIHFSSKSHLTPLYKEKTWGYPIEIVSSVRFYQCTTFLVTIMP